MSRLFAFHRASTSILPLAAIVLLAGTGAAIGQDSPYSPEEITDALTNHKDGDLIASWLRGVFGDLFSPVGVDGGASTVPTILSSLAGVMNLVVLCGGALILTYHTAAGVMHTAHEGEFLGKKNSTLWGPLRVVLAVVGMAPVFKGFCLLQVMVAQVALGGISVANYAWERVSTELVQQGVPVTRGTPPSIDPLIMDITTGLTCMYAFNKAEAMGGDMGPGLQNRISLVKTPMREEHHFQATHGGPTVGMAETRIVWSFVGSGPAFSGMDGGETTVVSEGDRTYRVGKHVPICNQIVLSSTQSHHVPSDQIMKAHEEALDAILVDSSHWFHEKLRSAIYGNTVGNFVSLEAAGNKITPADLARLRDEYAEVIADKIQEARLGLIKQSDGSTSGSSPSTSEYIAAMTEGGWSTAGSWYHHISAMNADFMSRIEAVPVGQPAPNVLTPYKMRTVMRSLDAITAVQGFAQGGLNVRTTHYDIDPSEYGLYQLETNWFGVGVRWDQIEDMDQAHTTWHQVQGRTELHNAEKQKNAIKEALHYVLNRAVIALSPTSTPGPGESWKSFNILDDATQSTWAAPLESLIRLGTTLINVTYTLAAISVGVSLGGDVLAAAPSVIGAIFGSGFNIGAMLLGILALIFGVSGAFLSYILPMLPYFMWLSALFGWVLLTIEAIIAGPLWAFAHMRLDGEGVAGPMGEQGYRIVLNVFLRPVLMLAGLFIGMAMFIGGTHFVLYTYGMAVNGAGLVSGHVNDPIQFTVMIVLLVVIVAILAERSFSLITQVPDRVMRWIGHGGENLGEEQMNQRLYAVGMSSMSRVSQSGDRTLMEAKSKVHGPTDRNGKSTANTIAGTNAGETPPKAIEQAPSAPGQNTIRPAGGGGGGGGRTSAGENRPDDQGSTSGRDGGQGNAGQENQGAQRDSGGQQGQQGHDGQGNVGSSRSGGGDDIDK
jgi:conjugal transfer/type IV secretion protein DotA/TraY